jgi:ABC-2 type transport system permease protein
MILFFVVVSISLMLIMPVALAILVRRRYVVPWWIFCTGMATFVISQLFHFPLNRWLSDVGAIGSVTPGADELVRSALLLGLSAALVETLSRVGGFWLIERIYRRRDRAGSLATGWQHGLLLGLGHGGIEAMGLVAVLTAASLSALWAMQAVELSTLDLAPDLLVQVEMQLAQLKSEPWLLLVTPVERGIALGFHVALALLVWTGVKTHKIGYVLVALAYHACVDAIAVYAGAFIAEAWKLQASLLILLLPGLIWTWRTRTRVRDALAAPGRSVAMQLKLFGTAVRKELLQQWHTKRILVVLAVFMLFGLGSPLIARFTPELIGSIEGAEQFADLIPSPTNADSLDQYVKNLTQFGFIIAILLGMGSVAGEREKGTAPMILSKPIPRWAFVASKFAALGLVYGAAFSLAAFGAYYYTSILFEPLSLGPFLLGNLLLWIWMLVFAAVTLVGTVLARSSGAAAGIALLGSIMLLLSGSLPNIGPLTPNGLVSWAGQLGLGAPAPINGGALVTSVTLIVISLLTAIAIFEMQEI